ncbi:MAG: glycoside hydrolase family 3 C-terminal domain-containing protein [Clostridiales bacterium]|nr:glycoside hydrolase family 3 C-terminal domain-containing protein [Clostridiales bacterium]
MEPYQDQNLSFEERAADLAARMTLEEKIAQVGNNTPSIPRLGVPAYNYWGEASHGFFGPIEFKPMDVTSYPVCLAMSQCWDREKIKKVADAISDEIRAHHNLNGIELHMWCPTINLARDPRNGRSDENMGEDPFLAGKMAASYIQGMQGGGKYLKAVNTPKHYALNSSENNRHTGSSNVDEATLREYYAKVFEYAVKEGKAQSIMTSYNRVNGVPSSVNDMLLTTLLREEWGFDGFVVSDCGAVADCYYNPMFSSQTSLGHYYCKNHEEASAMTLIAGTDVSCGAEHKRYLLKAYELGYISEDVITRAMIRALTTRFRLGLFDGADKQPYSSLGNESVCGPQMAAMAVDMANDSIVLLKNDKGLLPLDKGKLKSILVVGPNALYRQLGGYSAGQSPIVDTVVNIMALNGIRNEVEDSAVEVKYEKGWCTLKEYGKGGIMEMMPGFDPADMMLDVVPEGMDPSAMMQMFLSGEQPLARHAPVDPDYRADDNVLFARALEAAKTADAVIVVAGTDDSVASEEHDRDSLALPYGQDEKIQRLLEVNANTVVVLTTLGAVTGAFFDKAHTILNAHFAGQEQGTAIANVLFGKVNPNAKLSATWYQSLEDLPHVNDYGIKKQDTFTKKARTYMYFDGPVLFPFGHGLSYTAYEYGGLRLGKSELDANETLTASVNVTNAGKTDGAEIVQLYVSRVLHGKQRGNKPIRQLKGFSKVWLKAGETKAVTFSIPLKEINFWSNFDKRLVVEEGDYCVEVGGSSASLPCKAAFSVTGKWNAVLENVYAIADKQVYTPGQQGRIKTVAVLEDTARLCLTKYPPVFSSSNETVAAVSADGVVTAVGPGTALITVSVTYGDTVKSTKIPAAVILTP